MSKALKIKKIILILIAGILLTSSNSMFLVNAQPTPTTLTIAVPSPPLGKPFGSKCKIEATLKDEYGNPLPNMEIIFSECGSELIGTAMTDSNGIASITFFPEARMYPLLANFSGTTSYAQSGSEYLNITIIDYTPYLVFGGIIAVIAGYIVFRRKKIASFVERKLE